MQQPDFWYGPRNTIASQVLWPVALTYSLGCKFRNMYRKPWRASVPVICVGNLVVGGTGKTPTAIAIAEFFIEKNINIHFLSRGFGKKLNGPIRVDPILHSADEVGDEPLLLAQIATTWVSADRRASAERAIGAGATTLIMDDGFQNTSIYKDISILVIDGEVGFGNGKILPAGPLRENVNEGLSKANAVLVIGKDLKELCTSIKCLPNSTIKILNGTLLPKLDSVNLMGKKVFAFAGIGRPDKFFNTLRDLGCIIGDTAKFDDHHIYTVNEINSLVQKAKNMNATLVTTSKDYVRLNQAAAGNVLEIPVALEWENSSELPALFSPILPS